MATTKPTLTPVRATRFRRAFRTVCQYYRVTNATIGDAIDEHFFWARKAEFGGRKWVDNTMMKSVPLTHAAARRLAAALFLARDEDGAFAIEDDRVANAELNELLWLLRQLGAVRSDFDPAVPAFVAPEHVAKLAEELAAEVTAAVSGITWRQRPAVASTIAGYLRERGPRMNRAWQSALLDGNVLHAAGLSKTATQPVLDQLSHALFRDAYLPVHAAPSFGPEFDTLFRERDLFGFLFPPISRRAPSRNGRKKALL